MSERQAPAHGEVCYLQIPAREIPASASFYTDVFGWKTELEHASFEAPGLIGQFVADRPASAEDGVIVWIAVGSIGEALERAAAAGGETLEQPYDDGPYRVLATLRDPAGNTLGVVEHHQPHG
jgi:predicted enzyme related to lactoylglutathione lyase